MMYSLDMIDFKYEPMVAFDAKDYGECQGREPILRRLKDGSLALMVYTGGDTEPLIENYVLLLRSQDDGQTWTSERVFDIPERGCWGTEIYTEADDACVMFVHTFTMRNYYSELKAYNMFSNDKGKTWTDPQNVAGFPANVIVRRGVLLNDGTWLFPVYWVTEHSAKFCCGVIRSSNNGEAYSLHGYIHADGIQLWEPNVAELEPDHLVMYCRAEGKGELYFSESFDGGLTWSDATASGIPNPSSKVTLMKKDDTIIMLNSSCTGQRSLIDLKTSRDGKNWDDKFIIAEDKRSDEERPYLCYPDGCLDDDKQMLYVVLDSGSTIGRGKFYMVKIPYSDFL